MHTVCSGSLLILLLNRWSFLCGECSGGLKLKQTALLMCTKEHFATQTMKQSSCAADTFPGSMLVNAC